ncbi:hypothetical protein [Streptomyces cavernicola]|uniref:DUF3558 domain-containing protein n=1 Tax=Streptomyces cavernicola TaxID=3043613 RepID=A0ABT6SJD7_9ACTN|nr:hypothetical protein [Streptomyces sp. B-S-A6]MDI3407366.1 hypothetical protein [Streptomyces sp. B-S-A6]
MGVALLAVAGGVWWVWGGEDAEPRTAAVPDTLCKTSISTRLVKKMLPPGPYLSAGTDGDPWTDIDDLLQSDDTDDPGYARCTVHASAEPGEEGYVVVLVQLWPVADAREVMQTHEEGGSMPSDGRSITWGPALGYMSPADTELAVRCTPPKGSGFTNHHALTVTIEPNPKVAGRPHTAELSAQLAAEVMRYAVQQAAHCTDTPTLPTQTGAVRHDG